MTHTNNKNESVDLHLHCTCNLSIVLTVLLDYFLICIASAQCGFVLTTWFSLLSPWNGLRYNLECCVKDFFLYRLILASILNDLYITCRMLCQWLLLVQMNSRCHPEMTWGIHITCWMLCQWLLLVQMYSRCHPEMTWGIYITCWMLCQSFFLSKGVFLLHHEKTWGIYDLFIAMSMTFSGIGVFLLLSWNDLKYI